MIIAIIVLGAVAFLFATVNRPYDAAHAYQRFSTIIGTFLWIAILSLAVVVLGVLILVFHPIM